MSLPPQRALSPDESPLGESPRRRRPRSAWRRAGNALLGAVSAGGAGALTVWLAAPPAFVIPWVVGSLVVLGAVLGYRYGRGVVRATGAAFLEAAE